MSQPQIQRTLKNVHGVAIAETIFYEDEEFIPLDASKNYRMEIYEVD